jgi:F-type H+-transporting ATPase subunit b
MTSTRGTARRLAAALALTVVPVLLLLAAPAHAQTETTVGAQTQPTTTSGAKLDKFPAECLEKLEHGGKVADCHNAPKKFLPETNEIIWGSIFFVVVAAALYKLGVPAMRKGLQSRTDRIRTEVARAQDSAAEGARALEEARAQVAQAGDERERVLAAAREQAQTVRAELIAKAEADAAEARARAASDVRLASERARADLQARLARLSVLVAERVVERNLDPQTQRALVENYIEQVANRRN